MTTFKERARELGYTYEDGWSRVRHNPGWFLVTKTDHPNVMSSKRVTLEEVQAAVLQAASVMSAPVLCNHVTMRDIKEFHKQSLEQKPCEEDT